MAMIRSLLRVWPRSVAAPLPLVARPSTLRWPCWCIGTAGRNFAAISQSDKTGGDDALVRLYAGSYDSLRLILLLHHDRPHGHCVVVFDHIDEGAVRSA